MNNLPPILARDYRRVRVWPFVLAMAAFAIAGVFLAYVALNITGYVHQ